MRENVQNYAETRENARKCMEKRETAREREKLRENAQSYVRTRESARKVRRYNGTLCTGPFIMGALREEFLFEENGKRARKFEKN